MISSTLAEKGLRCLVDPFAPFGRPRVPPASSSSEEPAPLSSTAATPHGQGAQNMARSGLDTEAQPSLNQAFDAAPATCLAKTTTRGFLGLAL